MSVKIIDLLDTKVFSEAIVLAGEHGLYNKINRISFNDCEIREQELNSIREGRHVGITNPGDIFVSSLYLVKDSEQKMLDYFEYFILSNSSGMCIINEYIKELPSSVIDYANEHDYPIIMLDSEVPYADIIQTTMEMILYDQSNTIVEMKIDRLIDRDISKDEVIQSARHINGHFYKHYQSLYFKAENLSVEKKNLLYKSITQNVDFVVIHYKEGYLIIINQDKIKIMERYVDYLIESIYEKTSSFKLGISNTFSDISSFNTCVRQSISAFEMSDIIGNAVNYYKDLNVYKILYPLKSSRQLEDFYKEVFLPLKEYDQYYKSDIIETIEAFLLNDGDYKKTAESLHQHANTIRYRILKAKKILELENSHISFIEQISLALKINKILNPIK